MKSRDLGLLVLMASLGYVAVVVLPDGDRAGELWPTGLAAGVLLLNVRGRWPALAAAVLIAGTLSMGLAGRGLVEALGSSVGIALGALVVAEIATRGGTRRPSLRSNDDLVALLGAVVGGSAAAALASGLLHLATGLDRPGALVVATLLAHVNGHALLLPFFLALPRHRGVVWGPERAVQVAALVGVAVLVFWVFRDRPSMAFLVLPVLGWCALRASMRLTLVRLLVFGALVAGLTIAGWGPLAGIELTAVDGRMAAVHLYVLAAVVACLPGAVAVSVQRDVSRAAAGERDRMRSLVGSTRGIAIIGTDARGLIDLFNPGAELQLGYRAEEVMGRSTAMFHRQEEIDRLASVLGTGASYGAVARALCEPERAGTEVEFVTRDGDLRIVTMTLAPVLDADGDVSGYVSTSEDVTDRVRAHATLTDALVAEREAVDRLRHVDQLKDVFVSSVSHELRTPITSILGYLEILEEGGFGDLSPAQASALGRVSGNSERLLALIDDLLLLSQVQDDGCLETRTGEVDLGAVVLEAANVVAPTCESTGKAFGIDVPATPAPFLGDRSQLERAVINLLSNAVKFTAPGGRIDVTLRCDALAAVVSVRDTGSGIPEHEQGQVFQRFFRSSVAFDMAIQGSGLGLSITQAIAASHHGHVEFDSVPGEGSEFRLVFPLRVDAHAPLAAS